jgi:hypothetical protein
MLELETRSHMMFEGATLEAKAEHRGGNRGREERAAAALGPTDPNPSHRAILVQMRLPKKKS